MYYKYGIIKDSEGEVAVCEAVKSTMMTSLVEKFPLEIKSDWSELRFQRKDRRKVIAVNYWHKLPTHLDFMRFGTNCNVFLLQSEEISTQK